MKPPLIFSIIAAIFFVIAGFAIGCDLAISRRCFVVFVSLYLGACAMLDAHQVSPRWPEEE